MLYENLLKAARAFYGIGVAGIGAQQFFYKNFRPVIIPQWPHHLSWIAIPAYITGAGFIIPGTIIAFSKNAKLTSLLLALCFLLFFICFHITFQLFVSPNGFNIALWTDPLKELTFSGGAFIITSSYVSSGDSKSFYTRNRKAFFITGIIFFALLLIVFGIDHFLYTDFVATLVPVWIPGHVFWTYFAGIALIGSGVGILIPQTRKVVAILLGIMLFIWFLILHIPRAAVAPATDNGNELTSVFEALAFSGIAFVIAWVSGNKLGKQ